VYPAYLSAAREKIAVKRHFAYPFREVKAVLLRISCSSGSAMLDMEINEAFGGMEQEFLLPRNSRFRVSSIKEISNKQEMYSYLGIYTKNFTLLKIVEVDYLEPAKPKAGLPKIFGILLTACKRA